jgi:hypothetical protein
MVCLRSDSRRRNQAMYAAVHLLVPAAMFVIEEDTHVFWFNKDSFESNFEFELIGIVSFVCCLFASL